MLMKKLALVVITSLLFAGCGPEPARLTLRTVQDPGACPGAALPVPMRFEIDPLAAEQVVAIARDGRTYLVWWAPGFEAGTVKDPVVRAPNGQVVARDGEILEGPLLHGYTVCATGDSIYVLLI
jgi:hypothetical protein